ncbi:MAG: hypothetical protein ACK5VR_11580 [Burkholderiales bacterium]
MEISKIVIPAEAGIQGWLCERLANLDPGLRQDDRVGCGRPLAATRNAGSWMEQALSRKCNAFFPGYGAEVVEE